MTDPLMPTPPPPCACGCTTVLVTQVFTGAVQPVYTRVCKECGADR